LNPETGEISLNLDLNSKTGEKSPDRGAHAAEPTPPAAVVTDPGTGNPVRGPKPDERTQGYVK
jgi:hypothetical protein